MKVTKFFKSIAIVMVIAITLTCVPNVSAKARPKLNKKKVTMTVGTTVKLKMRNTKKKVKWSSSKKSVATVSKKGKVTGKKAGTAKITAKIGKKRWQCKVTVKAKKVIIAKKTIKQRIETVLKTNGWSDYDSTYGSNYTLSRYTPTDSGSRTTKLEYYPSSGDIRIYEIWDVGSTTAISGITIQNLNDKYCEVSFLEQTALGFGTGLMDKQNAGSMDSVVFDFYTFKQSELKDVEEITVMMVTYAMADFNLMMNQYGETITHRDLGFVF